MDGNQDGRFTARRLEFAGVTAAVVILLCLGLGQAAQQYAASVAPQVAQARAPRPQFNAIDYATTGSTASGLVVLGPCQTRCP